MKTTFFQSLFLIALLFGCTTESEDVETPTDPNTGTDMEDPVEEAPDCISETTNENNELFLFDIDQPRSFKRIIEEDTDRSNKFIYHAGTYVCTGTFNESFLGSNDGNLALYSLNEDLDLNWTFTKESGEFHDVIHTLDNHFVAVGRRGTDKESLIYVVKVDASGNLIWQYTVSTDVDTNLGAHATTVIEDSNGEGYFVLGKTSNGSDLFGFGNNSFVMYLNAAGQQDWVKSLETTAVPSDVLRASNDNLIVTLNDGDIVVRELTTTGEIASSNSFGSSKIDKSSHVLELKSGGYLITGTTWGEDGDVSDNSGNSDAWLLKLDRNLNLVQQQTLGAFGFQSGVETIERANGTFFMYGNTSNSDVFVDTSWNQEWYVELTSDLCVLQWYKSGLFSDKKVSDMIYFEEQNRMARFYSTNSAVYSNNPEEHYDQRIEWLHFSER